MLYIVTQFLLIYVIVSIPCVVVHLTTALGMASVPLLTVLVYATLIGLGPLAI